ncbi:uncharacterized protein BKA78DRAFT_297232 [Phyllosticta capitalensis]|uniref:uncharacterized protein n=1 Tax=Phyllosticta capitalensis TaxID=121624 RepID=UPI0031303EE7
MSSRANTPAATTKTPAAPRATAAATAAAIAAAASAAAAATVAAATATVARARALRHWLRTHRWVGREIVFLVVVCLALALWVAFGVALKHRDQMNTWIDVLVAAMIFSLWAIGQVVYAAVMGQERRAVEYREYELERARERGREEGREEMRRELGVAEEV